MTMKAETKKKLKTVLAGSAGVTIPGIITAMIMIIPDIAADMREYNRENEAGYKALAPAVEELQKVQNQGIDWIETHDSEMTQLDRRLWKLERRLYQCEDHIETLSKGKIKVMRPDPDPDPTGPPAVVVEDDHPPLMTMKKPHRAGKKLRLKRPKWDIPDDLDDAQQVQKIRDKLDCDEDDPDCGEEEIRAVE